jgi:hypothetical protein
MVGGGDSRRFHFRYIAAEDNGGEADIRMEFENKNFSQRAGSSTQEEGACR